VSVNIASARPPQIGVPAQVQQSSSTHRRPDPVAALKKTMRPYVIEDPAAILDHSRRCKVVGRANDQHSLQTNRARLVQHLSERPCGNTATTTRRPDAVSDMTHSGHKVCELVAKCDSAQQLGTVNDPSVAATCLPDVNGCFRVGRVNQSTNPRGKPFRGLDVILIFCKTETVLVLAWPPLAMRLKPRQVKAGCGHNQLKNQRILPVRFRPHPPVDSG
jgi:hypothetical protein